MDGDSTCIDGGHAGGSNNDKSFGGMLHDIAQESSLSGASFSREEDAGAGVFHKIPCFSQFLIFLHSSSLLIRMQR